MSWNACNYHTRFSHRTTANLDSKPRPITPRLSHEQYQHTQHMSPAPLTHTHTDVTNQEEDTLLHLAATSRVTDVQWASAQELLNDRTETAKERSHTHHHN